MRFRIRSILAAADLSEASSDVVRSAAALADLTGAELHVIHAQEPSDDFVAEQRRIHNVRAELDAHLRGVLGEGVRVTSAHVAFDRPSTAILQRAEQIAADLIVVGPHRPRGVGDRLLGTTADRIVRTAAVPCLIVRGPVSVPVRQVLVPSDLSSAARGALEEAFTWADALGFPANAPERTELKVLHVADHPGSVSLSGPRRNEAELELREQIQETLRGRDGVNARIRPQVVFGNAPDVEILKVVDAEKTGLLVMGTHGDGTFVRALLGSVSSAVARDADCPVLLVPPTLWRNREARQEVTQTPLPIIA
jgi:nucleotide-binding universal stress UspA family protein